MTQAIKYDLPLEKLCASYISDKMKPYIHNPQAFRNHFGSGDTVFRGARRQRGHGAVAKFAVPLISSGIQKAKPLIKKLARHTVKRLLPRVPFAQQIADSAVDNVTNKLTSKPMIEKVVGSAEKRGAQLFSKRKPRKPSKRVKVQKRNNVFYKQ